MSSTSTACRPSSHERLLEVPHPLAHVELRVALEHAQLGVEAHGAQLVDDLVRSTCGVRRKSGRAGAVGEVVQHPESGDAEREEARVLLQVRACRVRTRTTT